MKYVIRRAQNKDIPALRRFDKELAKDLHEMYLQDPVLKPLADITLSNHNAYTVADYKKWIKKDPRKEDHQLNNIWYVLEIEGTKARKVIGHTSLRAVHLKKEVVSKRGNFEVIFIDKNYRNKGYGKLLIEQAKKWFKRKKVFYIQLGADVVNKNAIVFYHKNGFKEVGLKMCLKID